MREELLNAIYNQHAIPLYGATAEVANPECVVKVVGALNGWEWYIIDGDKETGVFFGFVVGFAPEAGTFTVDEMVIAGGYVDTEYEPERLNIVADRGHRHIFG